MSSTYSPFHIETGGALSFERSISKSRNILSETQHFKGELNEVSNLNMVL
jgi:hypothetical protein